MSICGGLGLALIAGFWLGSTREAGSIHSAAVDGAADVSSRHVSEASESLRRLVARDSVSPTSDHVASIEGLQSDAPWESPTAGEPLDLAYLPSGAQLLLSWRPRDFLSLPEGERVLDVLGHYGEMARDRLPELAGTTLENIEQVIIAVSVGDDNDPDVALVIRPYEAVDANELLRAWNADRFESVRGGELLRGVPYARFLPTSAEERQRIVVVAPARVDSLLAEGGGVPLLPRDLESLVDSSDDSRHFNLIFMQRFANDQGHSLLKGEFAALHQPLAEFFGDEISAAALSVHLDENLFLELRAMPRLEQTSLDTSDTLLGRLDDLSAAAGGWVDSLTKTTHGAELLERWPAMLELAAAQTRQHVESRQVVLRAYLPSLAAHNLVLATRLALWHRAGSHLESAPAAAPDGIAAMAARLQRPVTLRFSSDTLEGALARLGELIDAEITIQGSDLQAEGITQNQSFAMDQHEAPAAEVLETILRRASPEGKLIYTISHVESADGSQEEVISVTTRTAAVPRDDILPAEATTQDEGK